MVWPTLAFIWGTAEATAFFIVPDVLLTLSIIRLGLRRGFLLSCIALTGAVAGGTAMHFWGRADAEAARAFLDAVPAISPGMIEAGVMKVQAALTFEMTKGALSGVPYKVFAVGAGVADIPLSSFMAASVAARMTRWILIVVFTSLIVAGLQRRGWTRYALPIWAICWIAFYAFYFSVMPD